MRLAAIFALSFLLPIAAMGACSRRSDPLEDAGATASPGVTASASTTSPASSAPPPDRGEPGEAFVRAMMAAESAIASGDYAAADRQLDAAARMTGDDAHLAFVVGLYRAMRFSYSHEFDRAALALTAVIPAVAAHPEWPDEFSAHNQMMLLREALGDPAAALAEDDAATQAATRGTWGKSDERDNLAYLKDRWHRAYLTRMLAESRQGPERLRLVRAAEASLDEYRARARKLGSNDESIAVLEAYFAALDGKREAALRAAKKVDPSQDTDLEDLYLVVVGLEAGGDHASAEAVRRRMRRPGEVQIGRPIMLRWIEHDAKVPRDDVFTPWHSAKPGVLPERAER